MPNDYQTLPNNQPLPLPNDLTLPLPTDTPLALPLSHPSLPRRQRALQSELNNWYQPRGLRRPNTSFVLYILGYIEGLDFIFQEQLQAAQQILDHQVE